MAALSTTDLTPILRAQPGVCRVCRGWSGGYPACLKCHDARRRFEDHPFPAVLPLSLAVHDGPLATALWQYKYPESASHRRDAEETIAWLLSDYGYRHLPCLAAEGSVDAFDAVTWIPSTRSHAGGHPLRRLLSEDSFLGAYLDDIVAVREGTVNEHRLSKARYDVSKDVQGAALLVVDDTWTSGGSALGLSLSLLEAGARRVAILVIGRHFRPEYNQGVVYSEFADGLGFDAAYCTYCDQRPTADPGLPIRAQTLSGN